MVPLILTFVMTAHLVGSHQDGEHDRVRNLVLGPYTRETAGGVTPALGLADLVLGGRCGHGGAETFLLARWHRDIRK